MKNNKIFLDFEEEEITIGLIKLKEKIPYHELFFKINKLNSFNFYRIDDLKIEDFHAYYEFPIFETFDEVMQETFVVIINKSSRQESKEKLQNELFDFVEEKYFLKKETDLIIFSKSGEGDFSNINFPSDWVDSVEEYQLHPEEELYQIILNYDE